MNKHEKKLLRFFREVPHDVSRQLLEYAEFLHSRHAIQATDIPEPQLIERPEKESVVAAVKRLSQSYAMLDKDRLLNETAALVSQNLMQGREAVEVIDELEQVFARHYQDMLQESQQGNQD